MWLKTRILNEIKARDKLYPGRVHFVDLINERYIGRKLIYDFLKENEKYLTGKLLDFGCGSKQYFPVFKHADEYAGLDVDTAMKYGFKADGITYYDGLKIPFDGNSFDSCVAIEVFEHIQDIHYSLSEIYRVLKPGGYLVTTCPMVYPIHMAPDDYWRYTDFGLKGMLNTSGFEIIKTERSSSFQNTLRRLKIINVRNHNWNAGKPHEFKVKVITVINNLAFILLPNNNENSLFPLNILAVAKKIVREEGHTLNE